MEDSAVHIFHQLLFGLFTVIIELYENFESSFNTSSWNIPRYVKSPRTMHHGIRPLHIIAPGQRSFEKYLRPLLKRSRSCRMEGRNVVVIISFGTIFSFSSSYYFTFFSGRTVHASQKSAGGPIKRAKVKGGTRDTSDPPTSVCSQVLPLGT